MPRRLHRQHPWSLDFFAGGLAGATATIITYPLDVIQTRLQSSKYSLTSSKIPLRLSSTVAMNMGSSEVPVLRAQNLNLFSYARSMIKSEGFSLFSRGLAANVVAISMSKAIYFTIYTTCKKCLRSEKSQSESTSIHVLSAALAGFVNCNLTNPIWFIKTRLQLDNERGSRTKLLPLTIYRNEGIRVFYSGLTASYLGVVETVLHFAIYEYLRKIVKERRTIKESVYTSENSEAFHATDCVAAATISKTIATVVAYPHEVFRTRMREQQCRGKSYSRLIKEIWYKKGWQGYYGGLATHLIRQLPNTAIVFLTYEAVVYFGSHVLKVRT